MQEETASTVADTAEDIGSVSGAMVFGVWIGFLTGICSPTGIAKGI